MKRTVRLLSVALLLTSACGDRSGPTEPQGASLDVPFRLRVGESAALIAEPLSIKFVRVVDDSRCPPQVFCIWSGEIAAALEIRLAGREPIPLEVSTVLQREGRVSSYRIRVLGGSGGIYDTPSRYELELLITKSSS